jgi:CBS domain-containing protein
MPSLRLLGKRDYGETCGSHFGKSAVLAESPSCGIILGTLGPEWGRGDRIQKENKLMTMGRIIEGNRHEIIFCETTATVEEATRVLASNRIGAMPVYEDGQIAGIFSERDVLYSLARDGSGALGRKVGEVMTSPAITVSSETGVNDALALMTRRRIRHLPVMEGSRVIGFVSIGDLVKYRIGLIEAEAEQMRQYIQTA